MQILIISAISVTVHGAYNFDSVRYTTKYKTFGYHLVINGEVYSGIKPFLWYIDSSNQWQYLGKFITREDDGKFRFDPKPGYDGAHVERLTADQLSSRTQRGLKLGRTNPTEVDKFHGAWTKARYVNQVPLPGNKGMISCSIVIK